MWNYCSETEDRSVLLTVDLVTALHTVLSCLICTPVTLRHFCDISLIRTFVIMVVIVIIIIMYDYYKIFSNVYENVMSLFLA